nr:MAG TPA: hypothetical protein [Caudoviricetes sp.]
MVKYYVYRITHGDFSLDRVPKLWQQKVEKELRKMQEAGEVDANFLLKELQ